MSSGRHILKLLHFTKLLDKDNGLVLFREKPLNIAVVAVVTSFVNDAFAPLKEKVSLDVFSVGAYNQLA